jgi:hypothetical protein
LTIEGGHGEPALAFTAPALSAEVEAGSDTFSLSVADVDGDEAVSVVHETSVPQRFRAYEPDVELGSESALDDPADPPVEVAVPFVVSDTLGCRNSARLCTSCSCWTLADTPGSEITAWSKSESLSPLVDAVGAIVIVPCGIVACP